MPKVMFLAMTAKPRPDHDFGKVGIWPFTTTRKARRSNMRTRTVAVVTNVLEPVSVTADEYRKVLLRNNGVLRQYNSECGGLARIRVNLRRAKFYGVNMMVLIRTVAEQTRSGLVTALCTDLTFAL